MIEESAIDQAISPQLITIGSILTKLRRGNMVRVHRFQHSEAEAIELITHGDEHTSKVVGRTIDQLNLPPGCTVAAVVRHHEVLLSSPHLVLMSGDHVILLLLKKKSISQIESLFQVSLTFVS